MSAFLDLYAPELIREGGPAKQVFGFADYTEQTEKWFAELARRTDERWRICVDYDTDELAATLEEEFDVRWRSTTSRRSARRRDHRLILGPDAKRCRS